MKILIAQWSADGISRTIELDVNDQVLRKRVRIELLCGHFVSGVEQFVMSFVNRANQSFTTHARLWYLIDARDQVCGRLACFIGQILQGKTKPIYHHALDIGDYVVVTNTRQIVLTGAKWKRKIYRHHTGYPGGLKEIAARNLHKADGTRILWRAVNGMLPKNNLRPIWMKRLYLFEDDEHPYAENIFTKLEAPAPLPKRLTEYTSEEISNYPRIY